MKRRRAILLVMAMYLFLAAGTTVYPQESAVDVDELKKKAPKIYIDCQLCDIDYIREKITFINYVWDRKEADIHILITTQPTGPGGQEYTISFIGQNGYKDFSNSLKYVANRSDSQDDTRKGLVHLLKMGLTAAAARTPISGQMDVTFKHQVKATAVEDRWNFWVFSIGMHGFFTGQKSHKSVDLNGNLSANRITDKSKLRLGVTYGFEESRFSFDSTSITSASHSQSFSGLYVKSINEHWSAGFFLQINRSTFRNLDFNIRPAPAIEYNIFPYSQSTRRQLRILYTIGYAYSNYVEETVYDKLSEYLLNESLTITLALKEPWGSVSTSLEGSHYFHDFSKNRFGISGELSLRLLKGLSLNLFGSYNQIHDQLSLSKGAASFEEVLLRRRELETNYSFFGMVGISYSFGSIFSNVVNPRFGSHGSGRTIIISN